MKNNETPVHLDNPLDWEQVPDKSLTFEFVADVEPGPVRGALIIPTFGIGCLVFALHYFANNLQTFLGDAINFIPLLTLVITLLLVFGWTIPRMQRNDSEAARLVLAGACLCLAFAIVSEGVLIFYCPGILLYYFCGEFAAHWSKVRSRRLNPILSENSRPTRRGKPALDYAEVTIVPAISSLAFLITGSSSGFGWLLTVLATLLLIIAFQKCQERETTIWEVAHGGWYHAYLYPNADATPPGLLPTPLLPQNLRAIPIALYLANMLVLAIRGFIPLAFSGLVLGFACWVLVVVEFCNED